MRISLTTFFVILAINVYSQTARVVFPSVFTIEYNSDSHIGGIADIGSVSSLFYPEVGLFQNPALLSTNLEYAGINISYMPVWLTMVFDVNIASVNGFYAIDKKNVIAYTFSRFSFGETSFTDEFGQKIVKTIHPIESYHQFSYSGAISNYVSLGIGIKLIDSDMRDGIKTNTFAFDLGFSYRKKYSISKQIDLNANFGSSINNLGPKVSYDDGNTHNFIPTNLKMGALVNPEYRMSNKFNLNWECVLQLEKDLLPSMPFYASDNNQLIIKGYNPDISSLRALYQSFYDSPEGFEGELKEIRYKLGTELRANYDNKFYLALRCGKYNVTSMYRDEYFTTGIGLGLFGFSLDFKSVKPYQTDGPISNYALTLGYRLNLDGQSFRF